MTNAEKYKDAIIAQMCKTGNWAVNKVNEIIDCDACSECLFRGGVYCYGERQKWLNAEADKKKAFSEKDKEVIRALDKVQWVVRDEEGCVYGYTDKPYKSGEVWVVKSGVFIEFANFSDPEFTAVKWEDDEPTSREEILGDEKK